MADKAAVPSPEAWKGERSYRELAEKIVELVRDGECPPGTRLPSERALAERFSVSRTAVREAIIALEVQGLVEVRMGSGIYIAAGADDGRPGVGLPSGPGPIEALRARSLIESEVAAQAAREGRDADLDRILDELNRMRDRMDDKAAYDQADRMFHLRIAEATGNNVLVHIVQSMWDNARSDPRWDKIERHFHTTALRAASLDDHRRIFAALLARDPEQARQAMRRHLERVVSQFSQTWR
ncbi:FadR/GntR family transcriptional regulator [Sphingomonas sp. NCPPB 2930]